MTARIRDFLKKRRESGVDEGPVLVVDLDVVRTNYQNFAKALPDSRVFYAVKANPAPNCWQGWTSLFGYPSRWWRPAKTREARSVVALSRVLCGEQSVLVSPPAADQIS